LSTCALSACGLQDALTKAHYNASQKVFMSDQVREVNSALEFLTSKGFWIREIAVPSRDADEMVELSQMLTTDEKSRMHRLIKVGRSSKDVNLDFDGLLVYDGDGRLIQRKHWGSVWGL